MQNWIGIVKDVWRHRKWLKSCLDKYHLEKVTELDAVQLRDFGIQVLALDYDGVLAPHGQVALSPAYHAWLTDLSAAFDGQIVILSNQPKPERLAYFQQNFPQIEFITGVAKKPAPDGLLKIQQQYQVTSSLAILLVDDRLLCGMLAVARAGAQGFYIAPPLTNFSKGFGYELFFACLRGLERCWVSCLTWLEA